MLNAALAGDLDNVDYWTDPVFGLQVPTTVPEVPSELLDPRSTWDDPDAFDAQARKLAAMFRDNFTKYEADTAPEVTQAGPPG